MVFDIEYKKNIIMLIIDDELIIDKRRLNLEAINLYQFIMF